MPPLAPRPFLQLARRCWSLRIDVPRGYFPVLSGAPWYRRRRRRPVHAHCRSHLRALHARRCRLALRPDCTLVYFVCEVA